MVCRQEERDVATLVDHGCGWTLLHTGGLRIKAKGAQPGSTVLQSCPIAPHVPIYLYILFAVALRQGKRVASLCVFI